MSGAERYCTSAASRLGSHESHESASPCVVCLLTDLLKLVPHAARSFERLDASLGHVEREESVGEFELARVPKDLAWKEEIPHVTALPALKVFELAFGW